MRYTLQDPHLEKLRDDETPVTVVLSNGVKLYGSIDSFDQYVVMVKGDVPQMVYKHAILHIQIARPGARKRTHVSSSTPVDTVREDAYAARRPAAAATVAGPPGKEPVVIVRKKHRTIAPRVDEQ